MNRSARKALIIGFGVAGPVLALFLQRAGIEAEIYEARAASTDYGGSFLNLASNGLHVLKELGLEHEVVQRGSPIPRMVSWSGKGKPLGEVHNGARIEVGAPSINILRSRLHQVLREEVERKGIKIHYGKKLVDLKSGAQSVVATFADGTRSEGTFVAGCDGVHSRIRRLINPDAPAPRYTGLISIGGFAQHSSFPPTKNTMHFVFGSRAFFGYHVSTSGEMYWFVNYPRKAEPGRGEVDMIESDEWQTRMLDLFRDDMPLISDMIRATDSKIIGYPFYDIHTQPIWYREGMVLVGDALHAVSASAGQGASMAIEDAIVLAKCLRDQQDLTTAFASYERQRRARDERVVRYGRQVSNTKVATNPVQVWLRDISLPLVFKLFANPASLDWIYSHHVAWNEPVASETMGT
ncbi:FAD-dependent oxidoreductase [Dictyobacter aurantiacus]|uniref:FAD-dependent oxidoreductase n=1 Tax=Dictyobacter aurantiacus TaxID=1936993 RepID=A0A401ZJN0_9CHLR|nr:FAD-dependent monooxygenase [Dictyobacter aurantiacus]GCE07042.1 FAD-dependent oxidoreductase [Dictyobacter aurantiacus]